MAQSISSPRRIPLLTTREEAAEFWDSHDSGDFEDEFKPVELEVARPLLHGFSVAFEGPVFDRILSAAKQRGVSFSQLAQQWILEGMERDEATRR